MKFPGISKFKIAFLILLIPLLAGCATLQQKQLKDEWFSKDKYAHFLVSTAISAAIANSAKSDNRDNCQAALIGFSVTLTLGAAKESYDKRKRETLYSGKDMTWNAAGSMFGSLLGSSCL